MKPYNCTNVQCTMDTLNKELVINVGNVKLEDIDMAIKTVNSEIDKLPIDLIVVNLLPLYFNVFCKTLN